MKSLIVPAILLASSVTSYAADPWHQMGKEWIKFSEAKSPETGNTAEYFADVTSLRAGDGFLKINIRIFTPKFAYVEVWAFRNSGDEYKRLLGAKYDRVSGKLLGYSGDTNEWLPTIPDTVSDNCKKLIEIILTELKKLESQQTPKRPSL